MIYFRNFITKSLGIKVPLKENIEKIFIDNGWVDNWKGSERKFLRSLKQEILVTVNSQCYD